ncbi:MAG TPA: hypothetical protein VGB37_15345 [Candidatus Lokiarchaeia archaeon]
MSEAKVSKNDSFNAYKPLFVNKFENENKYSEITQIKICLDCGAFNPKHQYICGMCKSTNMKKTNINNIKVRKRAYI